MSSGHGHRVTEQANTTQHLRPAEQRNASPLSGPALHVVVGYGGGPGHQVCITDVGRVVAHPDRDTQGSEAFKACRGLQVGAGHFMTHRGKNLCDSAHSRTAHADDVDPSHHCQVKVRSH